MRTNKPIALRIVGGAASAIAAGILKPQASPAP